MPGVRRMNINWQDLGTAFALYLVLEGVLPFLSPASAKKSLAAVAQLPERRLRAIGLVSMLAGCGLLFMLRG